ncbi:major facilitator superfamily domain-containing protein [Trichoderma compactum]
MIQSGDAQPQIELSPINQDGADSTEKTSANVYAANEEVAHEEASTAQTRERKPPNFYLAFLVINIVVFIFALDSTGLSVAIPSIAEQLHGTTLQSFWAGIAFILATVVTQPLYTSLSDIYGRKADISGRLLQGLGGGGLDVLGEIIVADMTVLKKRPTYLGIMAIPTAVGSTLGPSLGALLCQYASWRWIGWINLPCLGVAYPLVLFCLKLKRIDTPLIQSTKQLDWIGIALFTSCCILFILPLTFGLILFAWYGSKPLIPIIPHRLFYPRTASATLIGTFFHGMILFSLMQYLPFFYQVVKNEPLIHSALALLPTSVASVLAAGSSAALVNPLKGYRWSIWISWFLVTLGTGLLALLSVSSSKAMGFGIPITWGWGVGALFRVPQLPIQASVANINDTGLVIGLMMFLRLLGGLVGLAITSISKIIPYLPAELQQLGNGNMAIGFIPKLRTLDIPAESLMAIQKTYSEAFRAIFFAMTGACVLGLLSSLGTEELTLDQGERGQQQFDST